MNLENYKLVFSDEFDYEGKVDPEKWNYEVGNFQWPNRELQAYTDSTKNVLVKDGKLTITSLKEKDGEREYTSGKINTRLKGQWQYGYIEVRAKVPKGKGSWPAIWMMPYFERREVPKGFPVRSDGRPDFEKFTKEDWEKYPRPPKENRWPECGEIDIMEHIGRMPNRYLFSLHCGKHNHRRTDTVPYTRGHQFDEGFDDEFHVFGLDWTKDYIEYYVDGESYCRYNKADDEDTFEAWPFDREFYLIMNTAVGGGLGGDVDESALPYEFVIDYVRVYQEND